MKFVRQVAQPTTLYDPKAVGFMTVSPTFIHTSTITHTFSLTDVLMPTVNFKHRDSANL